MLAILSKESGVAVGGILILQEMVAIWPMRKEGRPLLLGVGVRVVMVLATIAAIGQV